MIEINRSKNRAKVKGINIIKKHEKSTKEKKGGIISKENFIDISNLKNLEMENKNKIIHAIYDDDDVLLNAVKELRSKKYVIEEVFTPFPVHGLDKALGLEGTRIAIMAFIYGCIGLAVSILTMNHMMIVDWPQNIGGKPSFSYVSNMPAFVPIMFEMTVFFAAHLMVITFYLRSKLWPFKKAENPYPSTTDDKFLIEIGVGKNEKELKALIKKTGAIDIKIVEKPE